VTVGRFASKRESALTEHRYNATVRCGVDIFLPHRKTPRGMGILAHVLLDSQPLPNRVPDNGAFPFGSIVMTRSQFHMQDAA
jgi:hypothetical protein